MDPQIERLYGNKVRVRVSGLCWREGNLLMVRHRGLNSGGFWAPPGGGIEFQESVDRCLQKEFLEETGLQVDKGQFLFGCEFLQHPLHAIELFFEVAIKGGTLKKGDDPELPVIDDVKFLSPAMIAAIPQTNLHGIFRVVGSAEDLKTLNGFFRI